MSSLDDLSTPATDPAQDPQKPSAFDPAKADAQSKAILAQGGSQHDVDTFLHQTYGLMSTEPGMQGHDYHAEYASGALAKRMAGANARDAANLADEDASQPGYLERAATHVLNTAQGMPGVEAVEAGAGALGSKLTKAPMTYRQSLASLKGNTSQIGGKTSFVEHMAGALPAMAMLPASPAASGAIIGGADQALSANPDESLLERGARTAAGAGVGALVGKGVDKGVTLARAALPTWAGGAGSSVDRLLQMKADRALSAKNLYSSAIAEGQANGSTPAIQAYVNEPEIADRIAKLQELEPLKKFAADSPEMLDALYKSFSDEAKGIKKGLGALDPTKINLGRFRGQHIGARQEQLLAAAETPGVSGTASAADPAMMPSYRTAVDDFAKRSQEIEALKKGDQATLSGMSNGMASLENRARKSPTAFADWVKTASPDEIIAARQGILGATKDALAKPGKTLAPGRRAAGTAADLLRMLPGTKQTLLEGGQNLGLLTAGNSTP